MTACHECHLWALTCVVGGPSQWWSGHRQPPPQFHVPGRAGRGFPRLGRWCVLMEFVLFPERPVPMPELPVTLAPCLCRYWQWSWSWQESGASLAAQIGWSGGGRVTEDLKDGEDAHIGWSRLILGEKEWRGGVFGESPDSEQPPLGAP